MLLFSLFLLLDAFLVGVLGHSKGQEPNVTRQSTKVLRKPANLCANIAL